MAVHKLLNRIVTPEDVDYERKNAKKIAADLHDYTFGLTSDRKSALLKVTAGRSFQELQSYPFFLFC